MKFFLQILTSFFLLTQFCFAQWIWQSPVPTGEQLNGVKFITTTTGWVVGSYGLIAKTTDGGTTWIQQLSGTSEGFVDVSFTDENTGTVVGPYGTILRTTNGGTTWTSQISGTTNYLSSVSFTDANTGTVVGESGTILRTTDGGTTWTSQISGTTNGLSEVSFTDANTGTVVGGSGTILRTTDGGTTWTSQISGTTKYLSSISFTDANTGTVVGESGTILRTTDGGTTWTSQISGTTYNLNGVSFTDAYVGTVVYTDGYGSKVLRTTDGGATWVLHSTINIVDTKDVSFIDANIGIIVGQHRPSYGEILKTTDGGITWTSQIRKIASRLLDISFANSDFGMIIGEGQTVLRTTNGGIDWISVSLPSYGFACVSIIDSNTGTLVGSSGKILRTTDRGTTWTSQISGTPNSLNSVSFTDANTGTAVGGQGTILRTTNGGTNWTSQISGITNILRGVSFTDANTGTAVGDNGTILRTTNGGTTWTAQTSGTTSNLYSVSFTDANTGTVVGGGIRRTTDGGTTWTLIGNNFGQLFSVSFTDANTGAAVGIGGIYRTSDGGTTWSQLSAPGHLYWDAYFKDWNNLFVVGGARMTGGGPGIILRLSMPNTPEGTNVQLSLPDVEITFSQVGESGTTSLTTSTTGPPPPSGFLIGSPPTYYEITTSAIFSGPIEICIDYTEINYSSESNLKLIHYENGAWVDRTISLDTVTNIICASVSSLSPFAIIEPGTGAINGIVSVNGNGLENVIVKLLDEFGIPVDDFDDLYTDANGQYSFADVPIGDYQIMIVEPLGYTVDQNPKLVTVIANETDVVNFELEIVVLMNTTRGIGYWKHQFDVYVTNRGNAQETEQELLEYIELVNQHYSLHYNLFTTLTTLEDWQGVLSLSSNHPMVDRAKRHLAALIMNMVSGKVGQYTVVTEDDRDVGDVIQFVSELIIDGVQTNDVLAKDLAESVNNQQMIAAGIVPEGNILFKRGTELGEVLTYELFSNYPNPFNPSTMIKYQIPDAGFVTLKVYDVLGNEVNTLVNERKEEGRYQVKFDATNLSSGVYIYRIQAGDFIETKKMVLMK